MPEPVYSHILGVLLLDGQDDGSITKLKTPNGTYEESYSVQMADSDYQVLIGFNFGGQVKFIKFRPIDPKMIWVNITCEPGNHYNFRIDICHVSEKVSTLSCTQDFGHFHIKSGDGEIDWHLDEALTIDDIIFDKLDNFIVKMIPFFTSTKKSRIPYSDVKLKKLALALLTTRHAGPHRVGLSIDEIDCSMKEFMKAILESKTSASD